MVFRVFSNLLTSCYVQGVSGAGVFCRWWLCHLLHSAGQKHPLTSPSGEQKKLSKKYYEYQQKLTKHLLTSPSGEPKKLF